MEGRTVGIAIATVFPAASSPPNLFCSRPTRPAGGKCIARSDTQDDNTDPSNSDSHGLNDLPAKLPLQDLGRHLAERCAQLLDEAMREIKILTQETQEVMQALASKHSEEFTLVISDVMEAIQAEHAQMRMLPMCRQQQSEKLHDYTTTRKRSKLSRVASAANRSQAPVDLRGDLLGPSNSENEASEHIDQQSYQAVDHANPILGMAPTAHHRPLNSSAQVTAAVHHELDQGASATLDQSNDDNLAVVTCQRQPEHCETQMTKEVACPRPACMSPFSMPILHEWPNAKLARRLYRWLELKSRDEDITGVWFKHDKPTPIEISAMKLKMQVTHGGNLCMDLCSAFIRLYQQLDAKMNTNPSGQRWRHFFPPQFALIAPVELAGGTWSCYIWDMEKRQMHILDPVLQQRETYNVSAKHRNSGFYTLYYSREFHDGKLQRSLDSGSITALRKDLLYQLLTMEGNYAELPSHIARYLE
uniref:Uncharacterized protein n=1 Tax=Oryza rufipogon TaxID=4529 RepID=A0A0E0PR70_ORYRU